jgi:error-prone DNA polymerase
MSDAFAHLHVASGFSLRYGASTPAALVERASALGQPALALTDRDGLYGAVRFVQACDEAGIAPVLGVDLAVEHRADPAAGRRQANGATGHGFHAGRANPARGGADVDPRHPRVTVLARGQGAGVDPGVGWGRLCRLVTQTHLSGERGAPVSSPELIAEHAVDPRTGALALVVLLGPASDVGQALLARRPDRARMLLGQWVDLMPRGGVVIEVVCHGGPEGTPASLGHAARLLGLATEVGLPTVLTAAVRHADPGGAVTVDVLDAARRLVPLDTRHLDRVTTAGHLSSSAQMYAVACDVARAAGAGVSGGGSGERDRARQLMADTVALAQSCALDLRTDIGIGSVHLPEPSTLGIATGESPQEILAARCRGAIATRYGGAGDAELSAVASRLEDELRVIAELGYPTYFMTVAAVCDLIRDLGVRVAARGSGAGSLVNYLLGVSGVEPLRHGLLMERFCSPLRAQLPDIDVDVESARRTEIYEHVLERFGGDRVTCVSMMDTYRARHAIRDVGAALGLPPAEIDVIAKAFPHIRARDVRGALAELPELRASGLAAPRLRVLFDLVERLDGLPRHIAAHPCGVILSNKELLDRTPVEASWLGFPMSQFDKDDVETLGLLKLDILGIRMQSAMAHAVDEVARVDGINIDLDDRAQVTLEDDRAFRLIRSTHTLGCFQIESPGQRELIGKFGPETFEDLIIDISLFRPGPVKSDMISPFLLARSHWRAPEYLHPSLEPALKETQGVVVFHEQVLKIVAETTGVTLAQADEVRRALGSPQGQLDVEAWWRPAAAARGYDPAAVDRIWEVLKAFASFGFCKAHAAAFALPTYQSAWLKAHHPAAFLSGVLTHDPGMYPKRLILDDARNLGITILGLDINASGESYRVERVAPWAHGDRDRGSDVSGVVDSVLVDSVLVDRGPADRAPAYSVLVDRGPADSALVGPADTGSVEQQSVADLPDGRAYGIRLSLADVKGISDAEVQRIMAGQPYVTLADFWHRAQVSRPVAERLVLTGGFDSVYGLSGTRGTSHGSGTGRRGRVTRRDLLLHVAELDRWSRSVSRSSRRVAARTPRSMAASVAAATREATLARATMTRATPARATGPKTRDVRLLAAAQSQGGLPVIPARAQPTQLTLDLGDTPELTTATGLPEMTGPEQVRAELDILGLDASAHIIDFYAPMLEELGVTRSGQLLGQRSRAELWVAGVKVATQTPPVRSGRRVVFLTLDDSTGPVDATFFEDVQGPYAATVFHSWMLLVRGILRRTGPKGVSLRATGAWELSGLWEAWSHGGLEAVHAALSEADGHGVDEQGADRSGSAGGMDGPRARMLVHASGFRQSPYADVKPAGGDVRDSRKLPGEGHAVPQEGTPPRKLWHASPGSSGR